MLFNDTNFNLQDEDIIIDHDIDEIIYKKNYPRLLEELKNRKTPLSIRLNQFFFKQNYLWTDCNFSSPTIYTYGMVKNSGRRVKGMKIKNLRDLGNKTREIHGCHMSWVIPVDYMINKLHSYSHPEFRKYANKELLQKAINDKIYIFYTKLTFNIKELLLNYEKVPTYLQKKNIFDYL